MRLFLHKHPKDKEQLAPLSAYIEADIIGCISCHNIITDINHYNSVIPFIQLDNMYI